MSDVLRRAAHLHVGCRLSWALKIGSATTVDRQSIHNARAQTCSIDLYRGPLLRFVICFLRGEVTATINPTGPSPPVRIPFKKHDHTLPQRRLQKRFAFIPPRCRPPALRGIVSSMVE